MTLQTEIIQRQTKGHEHSFDLMYHGPFLYNRHKTIATSLQMSQR